MPDPVFWREWQETWGLGLVDRVLKVKHIFDVSYRTVLYRLSENKTYGGPDLGPVQGRLPRPARRDAPQGGRA